MKEEIISLIEAFKLGGLDPEVDHMQYDRILEWYCLNYDPELIHLITELVELRSSVTFWYA